jgi:hypothetical protein
MPITPNNPFKERQRPGESFLPVNEPLRNLCVRLYLRYPPSYEHVTEVMAERGIEVDASCICAGCTECHRAIWHAFRLQPHRVENFKFSKDPQFVEKVRDIVGLYLNPPDRAIVLRVDAKSKYSR